ncbi:MAG TPA: DUF366 family protein [Planctomycetota bacterium]|nr:DUF366 family protein [Planctomycetota bacterium]
MISAFLPKKIKYTGQQLTSLWAYRNFGLLGDSIVAFIGPCNIPFRLMADVEDVRGRHKIYSSLMLHFIVEHFDCDLEKAVLRQRLLACIVKETLGSSHKIRRIGDDLYDPDIHRDSASLRGTQDAKLSISVATVSPVSTMIHFAINIETKRTPVKTAGLNDYKINPKQFALKVMQGYAEEMQSIKQARCKVYPAHK